MLASVMLVAVGFVGGFIGAYLMAKNNKKKAIEAINSEVDFMAQEFLKKENIVEAVTEVMDFVRIMKMVLYRSK